MSIAAKANKVCKNIKKPMSIASKTRKDQKAHERSSNPCEKRLKPMKIATKRKRRNQEPTTPRGGNVRMETPSVDKHSPLTRPHSFASPARSHARHEHETKPKPISRLGVSCVDYFPSISDKYRKGPDLLRTRKISTVPRSGAAWSK